MAQGGPGTELKALLASIGIDASSGCDCRSRARQMDEWGVEGCQANRKEIAEWLTGEANRRGWYSLIIPAVRSVGAAIGGWLSIFSPIDSIIDEAIRRAAERIRNGPEDGMGAEGEP